jgi:hypothetical protein
MLLQINNSQIDSIQITESNQTIIIYGIKDGTPFRKAVTRDLQPELTYETGKQLLLEGNIVSLCTQLLSVNVQ